MIIEMGGESALSLGKSRIVVVLNIKSERGRESTCDFGSHRG